MGGFFSAFAAFATVMLTCISGAYSAHIAPLSQYGQIPNVQTYSSNPLWNPNGPYNQTFPRPVYVDGPDLNSGDCERTVSALVASFCTTNNNCYGMQLSDIRPSIMLQLSRLPGHNWATQCMGYIDGAFDQYKSIAQDTVPTNPVSFPQGTVPSNTQGAEFKINNPFAPQIPDWAKEMQERKQELKQLQSQTNNYDTSVSYSHFPQTYYDLSFSERMDNETKGYEPYKDAKVYEQIIVEEPKKQNTQTAMPQGTDIQ